VNEAPANDPGRSALYQFASLQDKARYAESVTQTWHCRKMTRFVLMVLYKPLWYRRPHHQDACENIPLSPTPVWHWIPAFAGMTGRGDFFLRGFACNEKGGFETRPYEI